MVVRVTGKWEAESEDERRAVSVSWNLESNSHGRTLLTADVEVKLRRLTAIDYNSHNWSWLLDPNKPLEPPVIPKVPTSSKIQTAFEPEELAQEGVLLTVDLGKSRVLGRMDSTKRRGLTPGLRVSRAPR